QPTLPGVTTCQGGRESRPQGEVAQVIRALEDWEGCEMQNAETVLSVLRVITGEPDAQKVSTSGSAGGRWKRAYIVGTSPAAYPTRRRTGGSGRLALPRWRIRFFSGPSSRCSTPFTRRISGVFPTVLCVPNKEGSLR